MVNGNGRINSANARSLAAISWQKRRERAEVLAKTPVAPAPGPLPSEVYVQGRITQARTMIECLTAKAAKLTDPLDCERAARAVAAWSEIERILSGRPLPGARRPGPEKVPEAPDVAPL